jgi:DNA-binding transcriptional regulator YiaG
MTTPAHYRELMAGQATIGRKLLARALYAERHGNSALAERQELADLARALPEATPVDDALALLDDVDSEDGPDWRTAITQLDPPPAWAIRALRDAAGGEASLADALNTTSRTIRHWIAGDRRPRGPAVAALRMLTERLDP